MLKLPKLGCIIRAEVRAMQAELPYTPLLYKDAWTREVSAPRLLAHNDEIGNCAIVAALNCIQGYLGWEGNFNPLPAQYGIKYYSAVTGYVPGVASTDKGTDPEQLFAWWQVNPIAGFKLKEVFPINPADINGLKNAIYGPGNQSRGVFLCVELANEQIGAYQWSASTPNLANGHAIWADDYIADRINGTSWGCLEQINESFFPAQAAMAYALKILPD